MVVSIAEQVIKHNQALGVMRDSNFPCHTDAAMQLDGLLPDETGVTADT